MLGIANLSLKPFSNRYLEDAEGMRVALLHLLNILFADTPVFGLAAFDDLLQATLKDDAAVAAGVMGRIALMRANRDLIRQDADADDPMIPGKMILDLVADPDRAAEMAQELGMA